MEEEIEERWWAREIMEEEIEEGWWVAIKKGQSKDSPEIVKVKRNISGKAISKHGGYRLFPLEDYYLLKKINIYDFLRNGVDY